MDITLLIIVIITAFTILGCVWIISKFKHKTEVEKDQNWLKYGKK